MAMIAMDFKAELRRSTKRELLVNAAPKVSNAGPRKGWNSIHSFEIGQSLLEFQREVAVTVGARLPIFIKEVETRAMYALGNSHRDPQIWAFMFPGIKTQMVA